MGEESGSAGDVEEFDAGCPAGCPAARPVVGLVEPQPVDYSLDLAFDRFKPPARQLVVLAKVLAQHPLPEGRVAPGQVDHVRPPGLEWPAIGDCSVGVSMRIHRPILAGPGRYSSGFAASKSAWSEVLSFSSSALTSMPPDAICTFVRKPSASVVAWLRFGM